MDKKEALEKLKIEYKNMIIPSKLDNLINEKTIDCISNFILSNMNCEKFVNTNNNTY